MCVCVRACALGVLGSRIMSSQTDVCVCLCAYASDLASMYVSIFLHVCAICGHVQIYMYFCQQKKKVLGAV